MVHRRKKGVIKCQKESFMTLSGRAPYEYAKTKSGAHEVLLSPVRIRPEVYPLK